VLMIEPPGSTYLNPATGAALTSGQDAVIANPNLPDFREHVVLMNSDLSLFRANGQPVPDNFDLVLPPSREANDPEDQGEFSIGYRNEPWSHRFQANQNLAWIFSTPVHGDPDTPVFRAYKGDNVRLRVAQAVGDPRSTGFGLHGHRWRRSPNDPQSQIAAFQGQFNPIVAYNIHLDPAVFGGAGGPRGNPGDYLYRSGTLARHLTGGQWGIFRVFSTAQSGLITLPDHPI
jgi:manganese oxidase